MSARISSVHQHSITDVVRTLREKGPEHCRSRGTPNRPEAQAGHRPARPRRHSPPPKASILEARGTHPNPVSWVKGRGSGHGGNASHRPTQYMGGRSRKREGKGRAGSQSAKSERTGRIWQSPLTYPALIQPRPGGRRSPHPQDSHQARPTQKQFFSFLKNWINIYLNHVCYPAS